MDGILLFDKPFGWTSHDAVDFWRRRLGQRSIGHAGTLDPMATGLLVMLIGRFTKESANLSGLEKDYLGLMTLGLRTDTQDLEGKVIEEKDASGISAPRLEESFAAMRGDILQRPPSFSAARLKGRKSYELARLGLPVELEQRPVRIRELKILRFSPPDVAFFLSCSKGTYVRALCDDIGRSLGCGAALACLVRTRVGPYDLSRALSETDARTFPLDRIAARLAGESVPTPNAA